MSRLEAAVNGKKNLFIPFITAGDPNPEVTIELALTLEEAGADILELGIPYSDPLADGPVIQAASKRALKHEMTLEKALSLVPKMRAQGLTIPVIVFTYVNPLLQYGEEQFVKRAAEYQVDGILVPDMPFEEGEALQAACQEHNLSLISLVAPTSNKRIEKIAARAQGFVYCVSSLGVTGLRDELDPRVHEFLQTVKMHASVPVVVGFGISRREQVEALAENADGVVVGSAIVKLVGELEDELNDPEKREDGLFKIKRFVSELISS
ncbi:tryptophan synthase subunit alpha [Halalkalibacterium halodurans]|jgi:tryptophan synthase alpha chain|uniref:Tryptophan synthase alpha chain n=1 Tax=Halalkalibacterium halodurans TaxID=86665 RepID=A0A0M0KKC5_ALKHA|nr:tryptophan synthase subunit alpha [Halalkalibacterium halodurans]TPE70586.1 tryptophan synthase subunit alpha [Halalkalibacterium halodurans]